MGFLLKDIPGLEAAEAEASRREQEIRELAFLDVPLDICGVAVKQFTPRHFILLDAARVPFMEPAYLTPVEATMFLWVVSTRYQGTGKAARARFFKRVSPIGEWDLRAGLESYVEAAMMDAPMGGGDGKAPATSFVAAIVDRLCGNGYPWTEEKILDTPLARIFQYFRRIELRTDPRAILANPLSDRARKRCVDEWLEKRRKEAA